MDCVRDDKEFSAGINLTKFTLDNANLSAALKRIPSMTIKLWLEFIGTRLNYCLNERHCIHTQKSQEQ